ncbi:MAG: hypothetical protein RR620_14495 [Clostridium sp.]
MTKVKETKLSIGIKATDNVNNDYNQQILLKSIEQLNQNNTVLKTMEELKAIDNE